MDKKQANVSVLDYDYSFVAKPKFKGLSDATFPLNSDGEFEINLNNYQKLLEEIYDDKFENIYAD